MTDNQQNESIERADPAQFKKGYRTRGMDVVDAAGNIVHPLRLKKYPSQEVYAAERSLYPDDREEEFEDFRTSFMADKQAAIYRIATHLINKYNVKTIGSEKIREVFVYRGGVYVHGINTLRQEIRTLLEEQCSKHHCNEIIEVVKDRTVADRCDFFVDPYLINLNNGVLDIRTRELFPHDPKHLFFTKLPVDYQPDADCPQIKKFLEDTLEEEAIPVMQEWFGFGLFRRYFIKKAIILVGDYNTGKTALLKLFKALFGIANVAGVSLQSISTNRFATAYFHNKHLNIFDDLAYKDINDNGNFKMITGGDSIPAEYKFGNQFLFENYAKLMFTCNKIPDVKDANDDAYFDRWMVIHFNNEVDKDDRDPFLIEKITSRDELSGLLNFALTGLQRLLENRKFSYDKDADEIKVEMLRSGSPIASFAYDCLEEHEGVWISKDNMHEGYVKYARSNKLPIVSMKALGGKLPKCATYVSEGRPKDPQTGNQITAMVWMNVRFKSGTNMFVEDASPIDKQGSLGIATS